MEKWRFATDEFVCRIYRIFFAEGELICRDQDFRFGQSVEDFLDISGGGRGGYKVHKVYKVVKERVASSEMLGFVLRFISPERQTRNSHLGTMNLFRLAKNSLSRYRWGYSILSFHRLFAMLKKSFFWLIATMSFSLIVFAWCSINNDSPETLALAQCLSEKGAKMYGTTRCSHCNAQKEMFGYNAFQKVAFVDCDKNKNACWLAGVTGYPTWVFSDGTRLEGEQPLATLAQTAGCVWSGS